MRTRWAFVFFLATCVVVLTASFYVAVIKDRESKAKVAIPAYGCVVGPKELCASDKFFADITRWERLRKEIDTLQTTADTPQVVIEAKQDQFDGMTARLQKQIPSRQLGFPVDYKWDQHKKRFVEAEPIPPITQAPAPAPKPIAKPAATLAKPTVKK